MFHSVSFDASAVEALRRAQTDHDASIRSVRRGVSATTLDGDHRLWEALGQAIACLAQLVCDACAASAFCDSRPNPALVAARLSEALDDQIDAHVYAVIDAAARLQAS